MIAAGHHRISYAYPTSTNATRVGRAKEGAFIVYTDSKLEGFDTREDALTHARSLGTAPDRWSMDHPANAHFWATEGGAA